MKSNTVLSVPFNLFRITSLVVSLLMISNLFSQSDNPLPPGPARLNGTLIVNGKPYENASIIFFYLRDNKVYHTRFKSDRDGRFTVYVFENIIQPVVAVFISKKLSYLYIPKNLHQGANHYEIFTIDPKVKLRLEQRRYRKALKSIDL